MTHNTEKDACRCDPDDPCFCVTPPARTHTIRPSVEFVKQARVLGANRYPLRVLPSTETDA